MELLDKNLRLKKPIILNNVRIWQSLKTFYEEMICKKLPINNYIAY